MNETPSQIQPKIKPVFYINLLGSHMVLGAVILSNNKYINELCTGGFADAIQVEARSPLCMMKL